MDVAIQGNSGQSSALFFLLARPDSTSNSRMLFIDRGPARQSGADYLTIIHAREITGPEAEALHLKTDAIQYVVPDKASVIYYIDHGKVRDYSSSD